MRGCSRLALCAVLLIALAACAGQTSEPKVEYRTEYVAVSTGCVVDKPEALVPLKEQIAPEQWARMAPGAKAEAVKAQAGYRMNYLDELLASTSGCKNAEPSK